MNDAKKDLLDLMMRGFLERLEAQAEDRKAGKTAPRVPTRKPRIRKTFR